MENIQKGSVRIEMENITILDYNISRIIVNALSEEGYNVLIKPIREGKEIIGENITIYRNDGRRVNISVN